MPKFRTHLPDGLTSSRTLCGQNILTISVRGVRYWRTRRLEFINPSEVVDKATCKACQRVDDVRQVRDYLRECREANIDPSSGQPLRKVDVS